MSKCASCGVTIDHLTYLQPESGLNGIFTLNEKGKPIYVGNHPSQDEVKYICPCCAFIITYRVEKAIQFLKSGIVGIYARNQKDD